MALFPSSAFLFATNDAPEPPFISCVLYASASSHAHSPTTFVKSTILNRKNFPLGSFFAGSGNSTLVTLNSGAMATTRRLGNRNLSLMSSSSSSRSRTLLLLPLLLLSILVSIVLSLLFLLPTLLSFITRKRSAASFTCCSIKSRIAKFGAISSTSIRADGFNGSVPFFSTHS